MVECHVVLLPGGNASGTRAFERTIGVEPDTEVSALGATGTGKCRRQHSISSARPEPDLEQAHPSSIHLMVNSSSHSPARFTSQSRARGTQKRPAHAGLKLKQSVESTYHHPHHRAHAAMHRTIDGNSDPSFPAPSNQPRLDLRYYCICFPPLENALQQWHDLVQVSRLCRGSLLDLPCIRSTTLPALSGPSGCPAPRCTGPRAAHDRPRAHSCAARAVETRGPRHDRRHRRCRPRFR
jgi:hypothetical protein